MTGRVCNDRIYFSQYGCFCIMWRQKRVHSHVRNSSTVHKQEKYSVNSSGKRYQHGCAHSQYIRFNSVVLPGACSVYHSVVYYDLYFIAKTGQF